VEKLFEFYTTWLRLQQDFLIGWFTCQKELMGNWLEGVKSMQMPFGIMAGSQGGSQQFVDLYNSWVSTMANSSKGFVEGITNFQNAWKTMMERQMEMSKETSKQLMDTFKRGGETK
jgi:hypothetical protein